MASESPPGLRERAGRLARRVFRSPKPTPKPSPSPDPSDPLWEWIESNIARLVFVVMAIIPLTFAGVLLADDQLDGAGAAALVGMATVSVVLAVAGPDVVRRIRRIGPWGLELGEEEEAVELAIGRLADTDVERLEAGLEEGFNLPDQSGEQVRLSAKTLWGYELGTDTVLVLQHQGMDPKRLSREGLALYRRLLLQVSKVAAWREEYAKALYMVRLLEALAETAEEFYVVGAVYRFAYARMEKLKEHLERARTNLEQASDRDRENPSIEWQLGWVYDELGYYGPAIEAGRRAIEINRERYLVMAGWQVSVSLSKSGKHEEALQQLEEIPAGPWWEEICSDEELVGLQHGNFAERFAALCTQRRTPTQS